MESESILGFPVATKSLQECISDICTLLRTDRKSQYFVCANPHSLEVARTDRLFFEALHNAEFIIPDGIGVVLASKILGGSIRDRITGMDIFLGLSAVLNRESRFSYFFLGSTEQNLEKIKERLGKEFPGIKVSGTYSPPFKPEFSEKENQAIIAAINEAKPDVLWVGMTAPKQEKWIYQNKDRLDVKFVGAIGAVFDFYTGNVKRSHPIFQKMGLEWLPRLLRQPRRLWRRNFVSNPRFLLRVFKQRLSGSTRKV